MIGFVIDNFPVFPVERIEYAGMSDTRIIVRWPQPEAILDEWRRCVLYDSSAKHILLVGMQTGYCGLAAVPFGFHPVFYYDDMPLVIRIHHCSVRTPTDGIPDGWTIQYGASKKPLFYTEQHGWSPTESEDFWVAMCPTKPSESRCLDLKKRILRQAEPFQIMTDLAK